MTNPDWDGTMKAKEPKPGGSPGLSKALEHLSEMQFSALTNKDLATRIRERLTDQVLAELLVQSPGIPGGIEEFYAVWREGIISAIVGEEIPQETRCHSPLPPGHRSLDSEADRGGQRQQCRPARPRL